METQALERVKRMAKEDAEKLYDFIRTAEEKDFSLPWRGKEKEPISYEEYITGFALILAMNRQRSGDISPKIIKQYTQLVVVEFLSD